MKQGGIHGFNHSSCICFPVAQLHAGAHFKLQYVSILNMLLQKRKREVLKVWPPEIRLTPWCGFSHFKDRTLRLRLPPCLRHNNTLVLQIWRIRTIIKSPLPSLHAMTVIQQTYSHHHHCIELRWVRNPWTASICMEMVPLSNTLEQRTKREAYNRLRRNIFGGHPFVSLYQASPLWLRSVLPISVIRKSRVDILPDNHFNDLVLKS